jgi:hypothetical protein
MSKARYTSTTRCHLAVLQANSSHHWQRPLPMTTLDREMQIDVKLDTHGFEVPILEGALEVLNRTNLVVMEVYNFNITGESLLFFEMCEYMRRLGFSVIDISEPMWRQYDKSFWQFDAFFKKSNGCEFSYTDYL